MSRWDIKMRTKKEIPIIEIPLFVCLFFLIFDLRFNNLFEMRTVVQHTKDEAAGTGTPRKKQQARRKGGKRREVLGTNIIINVVYSLGYILCNCIMLRLANPIVMLYTALTDTPTTVAPCAHTREGRSLFYECEDAVPNAFQF